MNAQIHKYLIAPQATVRYLLIEEGVTLAQNFVMLIVYIKMQLEYSLPFGCGWIQCSWLFTHFVLNLSLAISRVLFLPQLMTLPQNKTKRDRVMQLRLLFQSGLSEYLKYFQRIMLCIYRCGFVIVLWDLVFGNSDECYDQSYIRTLTRWILVANSTRWLTVSVFMTRLLQKQIIEESQKDFIFKFQKSEIPKHMLQYQDVCSICLAPFGTQEQLAEYLCQGQHIFHAICIERWLQTDQNQQKSCPLCKQLPTHYD